MRARALVFVVTFDLWCQFNDKYAFLVTPWPFLSSICLKTSFNLPQIGMTTVAAPMKTSKVGSMTWT